MAAEAMPTRAASVECGNYCRQHTRCQRFCGQCNDRQRNAASLPGGGPIIVFGAPIAGGGTQSPCPGNYAGYVSYTKTISQGWGWAPAGTVHTASDGGGRTDTTIVYLGLYGDTGCNQTSVTIPNPPSSPAYRFAIYFLKTVPTTNYPIVLTGFNP